MRINISNAKYSAIVSLSEKHSRLEKETNKKYLHLNRGINTVCNIDLTNVVKELDFNSNQMQYYPSVKGSGQLKSAINKSYFANKTSDDNILVTGGSTCGLDITFQTLQTKKILLPAFYWGSYANMCTIRGITIGFYESFTDLLVKPADLKDSTVVICDPNNPLGDKYDDIKLIDLIEKLNLADVNVIIDSPYRRVFYDDGDELYQRLFSLDNVIIIESFSKSIGLSGQRIGFVHSVNQDFLQEFAIRLTYATNGINSFAQMLVRNLLTTDNGKKAVRDFKEKTTSDIKKNINLLIEKNLLATEFYSDSEPMGIFVVVNKSYDELIAKRIGGISLEYFTQMKKEYAQKYSRICVSVPHEDFAEFFTDF